MPRWTDAGTASSQRCLALPAAEVRAAERCVAIRCLVTVILSDQAEV